MIITLSCHDVRTSSDMIEKVNLRAFWDIQLWSGLVTSPGGLCGVLQVHNLGGLWDLEIKPELEEKQRKSRTGEEEKEE